MNSWIPILFQGLTSIIIIIIIIFAQSVQDLVPGAPSSWLPFLKPCRVLIDEAFLDDSAPKFVVPSEFLLYFEVSSTL